MGVRVSESIEKMTIVSALSLLAFSFTIFHQIACSSSSCPLQDDATVFLLHSESNPLENELTRPDLRKLSCNQTTDSCCVCDEEDDFIIVCTELTPALAYISNSSYHTVMIGREGLDTNYTLNSTLNITGSSEKSISFIGYGQSTVNCGGKTGIQFYHFCRLYIKNIVWDSCMTYSNSTLYTDSHNEGGMILTNCYNVTLEDVTIINAPSTGVSISLTLFNGRPYIYSIINSSFMSNGKLASTIVGGGIDIYFPSVPAVYSSSLFSFDNVVFTRNKGGYGGAVGVTMKNLIYTNCQSKLPKVQFKGCNFITNSALKHGGGVYLYTQSALFEASFTNCNFSENLANDSGGGAYLKFESDVPCSFDLIKFVGCNWRLNKAIKSFALKLDNPQTHDIGAQVYRNRFEDNLSPAGQFLGGDTSCTFESKGISVTVENVEFVNNNGTGLCVKSTTAKFIGNVLFYHNTAFKGGGIHLGDGSLISLEANSFLNFTENTAVYGGGIYQETVVNKQASTICFSKVTGSGTDKKPALLFQNNRAYINGKAIFFGDPIEECITEKELLNTTYISADSSSINQVTSLATSFQFSAPIVDNHITMILGQYLILNTTLHDLFHNSTIALINVFLLPQDGSLFGKIYHELVGFKSFTIESGINTPNLYIEGPPIARGETVNYTLIITQADRYYAPHQISVKFTLKSCSVGFKEGLKKCECASSDVQCNFTNATACIRKGYWHGKVIGNNTIYKADTHVTEPCTSGKCKNINNCQHCSSEGLTDYCRLPSHLEDQCTENQGGPLCTECNEGYSYTFGAVNCAPVETCEKGRSIGLVVATLLFILTLLILMVVLLKLGKGLTVGHMFSVVYFFSVVKFLLAPSNVTTSLQILTSVFQSITQLNPHFLGYIPACLSKDSTILEHQMLFYTSPLVISIIVMSVVWLSKCCPRYLSFTDNTPVRAISLLILLSFTALAETSFNIINPLEFEEIKQIFVNIQPSTKYCDVRLHLPWFLVGLLVEVLLVLPFTFILVFAPLLIRCCNLNKIKPFLDEFQDCYKDKYRWMAGYYFVCRQLYLAVSISPRASNQSLQYSYQVLTLCVLILHITLLPYKSNWLNALDSILLADLLFIAVSYGVTADIVYSNNGYQFQLALTYFLILVPVLYAIGGLLFAFSSKIPDKYKDKLSHFSLKKELVKTERADTLDQPLLTVSFSEGYREPVLGFLDSERKSRQTRSSLRKSRVGMSVIESPQNFSYDDDEQTEWQKKSELHKL